MRFHEIRVLYFYWEYPLEARMYFRLLQRRLVEGLRRSIGNGLMTERGLARWAGISQPHMHHILKGERAISPRIADRLLEAFELSVIDLLELAEMQARAAERELPGVPHDRIQTRVDKARALRECNLRRVRTPVESSPGAAQPPPGRLPEPGEPPPPN